MSQLIFPKLQGLSWETSKKPIWKTRTQEAASGCQTSIKLWSYPKYEISLKYNFMTNQACSDISLAKNDYEKMCAFFNLVGGSFDNFLFEDRIENTVTNQVFGLGDGITTQFQLNRTVGAGSYSWIEPIFGIKGTPVIKVAGIAATNFTINDFGLVTFDAAPDLNAELSWSGNYYFRCKFTEDELPFDQTDEYIYENIKIDLITEKL